MPPTSLRARDAERMAFLHSPDATLILENRMILRANPMVETVFGHAPAVLEGQSVAALYMAATDYRLIGARAYRAMETAEVYSDKRVMRHARGHAIWVQARGRALSREAPERLSVWTYRLVEEAPRAPHGLTPAEMRVARYLVNGFTSKEIAASLGCSPRTVEVHRAAMIRKAGVRNTGELVMSLLVAEVVPHREA